MTEAALPTIRPMAPVDIEAVVNVHLAAFPGFFLTFLGPRFLDLFYRSAVGLREICFVAVLQSQVVGFVMGSHTPGSFFKRLLRNRGLAFALASIPALLRRPRAAFRLARALTTPTTAARPAGTATLMSLAVDPRLQGRGAGKALVEAFLDEASRRGALVVDLSTDKVGNDSTNRFYRSLGFSLTRERTTSEGRAMYEYSIRLPELVR